MRRQTRDLPPKEATSRPGGPPWRRAGRRGVGEADRLVGARLRTRRMLQGVSQTQLGEVIGVSFQQIQKYEKGQNRISASVLEQLAAALEVPVTYFFGEPEHAPVSSPLDDLLLQRETQELIRAYYGIADAGLRRHFVSLMKAASATEAAGEEERPLPHRE